MPRTAVITATRIHPTPRALVLYLPGQRISVPWRHCSEKLAEASTAHRLHARLGPGGYGVHWPVLDEDLSVAGLIQRAAGKPHVSSPTSARRS